MAVNVPPGFYDTRKQRGTTRSGNVTLTTAAQLIVSENTNRIGLVVLNTSADVVFVGSQVDVTAGNGFALPPSQPINFDTSTEVWASGSAGGDTISWIEEQLR